MTTQQYPFCSCCTSARTITSGAGHDNGPFDVHSTCCYPPYSLPEHLFCTLTSASSGCVCLNNGTSAFVFRIQWNGFNAWQTSASVGNNDIPSSCGSNKCRFLLSCLGPVGQTSANLAAWSYGFSCPAGASTGGSCSSTSGHCSPFFIECTGLSWSALNSRCCTGSFNLSVSE